MRLIDATPLEEGGYKLERHYIRNGCGVIEGMSISCVPTVDVEQRWILCNERLPVREEEVIVSCHDDSGDTPFDYTACGYWVGLLPDDDPAWIVDGEVNYHVVAWMPLPKPYKI